MLVEQSVNHYQNLFRFCVVLFCLKSERISICLQTSAFSDAPLFLFNKTGAVVKGPTPCL